LASSGLFQPLMRRAIRNPKATRKLTPSTERINVWVIQRGNGPVGVGVAVGVGVEVGVGVGDAVGVGDGVDVGLGVDVGVAVGVPVGDRVGVAVCASAAFDSNEIAAKKTATSNRT
jgi:hypothetical protein